MSEARWFIAVLVVASEVEPGVEGPLVDLQHRLIRATDPDTAHRRALELGALAQHSYRNAAGSEVTWRFAGLHDLREIDDHTLGDGSELYSTLVRRDPQQLAVPKDKLTAFWVETNKHRTARDLLENE